MMMIDWLFGWWNVSWMDECIGMEERLVAVAVVVQ